MEDPGHAEAPPPANLESRLMRLDQLSAGTPARILRGDGSTEIVDVAFDSRKVEPGTLFFCVRGASSDGHDFAPAVVEAGAVALVVDHELDLDVPQLLVEDTRRAMGPLAAQFFGEPSRELRMVGVTGTNGKTTTAFLTRAVLEAAGFSCGLLGTVKQVIGGVEEEVVRTTPEAIDLQRTFRRMLDAGDEACVIEVSSHALVLGRADAIHFDVAAFTNLTQDHLDFHSDMEDYFRAKRLLFEPDPNGTGVVPGAAAVNVDDPHGAELLADLRDAGTLPATSFSAAGADADLSAHDVSFDATGSRFELRTADGSTRDVELGLPGHFNVENALAALACTGALGIAVDAAARALATAEPVPGRMEPVDAGQDFGVIVDYAHTPDSLENVLRAARRLTEGRLICVYGCGGDRDASKRPLMGGAGAELSDVPVVTSDNPRSEDPEAIISQMVDGIPLERRGSLIIDADRRRAIATALAEAKHGDLVVIAGKGHEQGQEFADGRKEPFDDRDVAREELAHLRGAAA